MALARLVPVVLLAGGAVFATRTGGEVTGRILDTVKSVVTRFELGQIQRAAQVELLESGPGGFTRGQADFHEFIRQVMDTGGRRDPTLDPWGETYRIRNEGDRTWCLSSLGPNKTQDGCADAREANRLAQGAQALVQARSDGDAKVDPDRWWARQEAGVGEAAAAVGGDDAGPDDLCVRVTAAGGSTPYRRLVR